LYIYFLFSKEQDKYYLAILLIRGSDLMNTTESRSIHTPQSTGLGYSVPFSCGDKENEAIKIERFV